MKPPRLAALLLGLAPAAAPGQGSVLYTLEGGHRWDTLGAALAPVGDLDGDGAPDFVVGAPQEFAAPGGDPPGYVHLVSGRSGKVIHTWQGERAGEGFGTSVARLEDVDGDGTQDIAVVSELMTITVISGRTKDKITRFNVRIDATVNSMEIAICPDLDGDGIQDLVVGVPSHDVGADLSTGRVSAHSIKEQRLLWNRLGTEEDGFFGSQVATLGDVDGDGLGDVAASHPRGGHNVFTREQKLGEVRILSGKDGSLLRTLGNEPGLYYFGEEIAVVGDLDGDLHPELAVSAGGYGERGLQNQGWVGVYSTGKGFRVLHRFTGVDPYIFRYNFQGDALGYRMSGAGDADGDGVPDLLLAAERWSSFWEYPGRIHLHSGRTGKLLASYELIQGTGSRELLGSLSPLGDVDGDGRSEFLIGAWDYNPLSRDPNKGAVFALRFDPALPVFLRGDANADGRVDLSDGVSLIQHVFLGGPDGGCALALDIDGSGKLDFQDFVSLASYLFAEELAPAPPFPACGRFGGPRESPLGCRESACPREG
ncbi:MAG: hypothetical protein ACRD2T_03020 [Thermoanaerobaculia bacterium]